MTNNLTAARALLDSVLADVLGETKLAADIREQGRRDQLMRWKDAEARARFGFEESRGINKLSRAEFEAQLLARNLAQIERSITGGTHGVRKRRLDARRAALRAQS